MLEKKARKHGIDVTAIECDGSDVYYTKDGYEKCPDKWYSQWDDERYRYDDIYHPNRLYAAVLIILVNLGLKAVSALPTLLNFVWDSGRDNVQTPWEEAWQVEGGYTYVKLSELLDSTLYKFGPQIIPDLIRAGPR